jgi:hypothetical protein
MKNEILMIKKRLPNLFGLFVIMILLFPIPSGARNLLNNPESVVFDSLRNRYLVSNWGDGAIVQIDSLGIQSYYSTELLGQYGIAGLYIFGDTLLAAAGNAPNAGIVGFNLETAEQVFHIAIPGIGLPNDITSVNDNIIYVTDYWGNRLYKITNHVPSVFMEQGLNSPNGMIYDQLHNRLLILSVMGPGAPILGVSLEDSSLSTVVATGLSGTDGITMDGEGRVYVSEWTNDTIVRYDSTFAGPSELFSTGHYDPADIYYDRVNDLLVVPNFSSHTLDFIQITPVLIDISTGENNGDLPRGVGLHQNNPNPFNPSTTIEFDLYGIIDVSQLVSLTVYDIRGRRVRTLLDSDLEPGSYKIHWDGRDDHGQSVASGIYLYTLRAGEERFTRKMTILK